MVGGGGTEKDHFTSEGDRGQASTGPHSVLGMRCGNCGGLDCSQSLPHSLQTDSQIQSNYLHLAGAPQRGLHVTRHLVAVRRDAV